MMHFPDRPNYHVPYEDIPSEEECRRIIVGMKQETCLNQSRRESLSKRDPTRMSWSSLSAPPQGSQGGGGRRGGDKAQRPKLQVRIPDARIARQRILLQTTRGSTAAHSSLPASVPEEDCASQHSQATLLPSQCDQAMSTTRIARKPLPVNSSLLLDGPLQRPKTTSVTSSTSRGSSVVVEAPEAQPTKPLVVNRLQQHIISAYAPGAASKQTPATGKQRFSFSRFWAEPPPTYSGHVAPIQPAVYSCHLCRITLPSALGLCKGCQEDFAPPKDIFIDPPAPKRSSGNVIRTETDQMRLWRLSNKPLPLLCPGPKDKDDAHGKAKLGETRPPPGRHDHVRSGGKSRNNIHLSVARSGSPRIIATQHPRQNPNIRDPVTSTKGENIIKPTMGLLMASKVTWRPSNQPKEVVALGQKAPSHRPQPTWWF